MGWKDAPLIEDKPQTSWRDAPFVGEQQPSPVDSLLKTAGMGALSAARSLPVYGQTGAQLEQAVFDPREALKTQAVVGSVAFPVGSVMAYGTNRLLSTPFGKQATDISQSLVSKIPKELLGSPEPMTGVLGALGEIGRRTTPEQYREIPKATLTAAAFGIGQNLQDRFVNWSGRLFDPMAGHKEGLLIAQDGLDLAKSAKSQIDGDIKVFRNISKEVPVEQKILQDELNSLYGTTRKDVVEKLPIEFIDDMGKIAVSENTNIGLVDDIKDVVSKHIKWNAVDITPTQQRLRNTYFNLDKMKDSALGGAGLIEEKQHLDALNQVATEVYGEVASIKQMVRGSLPKSKIPSPAGLIGAATGDVQKREVLERLSHVEPKMRDLIQRLIKYSNSKGAKELIKQAGLATVEHLPAGALIGKMLK